jgi:DNA-binding NarL/FixJ family response regulator
VHRETLAELCEQVGLRVVCGTPDDTSTSRAVQVVVYDGAPQLERRCQQIDRLSERFPTARLLLLLDFPRHQECRAAHDAGVCHVLGKPYRIDDLFAALQYALELGPQCQGAELPTDYLAMIGGRVRMAD